MAQNNNLNETSLKNNGFLPKVQVFSAIFAKITEKNPIYRTFQKDIAKNDRHLLGTEIFFKEISLQK